MAPGYVVTNFLQKYVLNKITFLCSTVASMPTIGSTTLDLYGELLNAEI